MSSRGRRTQQRAARRRDRDTARMAIPDHIRNLRAALPQIPCPVEEGCTMPHNRLTARIEAKTKEDGRG